MSYTRAAAEAPREHGLVAGAMTGAWTINRELEGILHALRRERPAQPGLPPNPPPEIEAMARETLSQHNHSFELLRQIRQILELHLSK